MSYRVLTSLNTHSEGQEQGVVRKSAIIRKITMNAKV